MALVFKPRDAAKITNTEESVQYGGERTIRGERTIWRITYNMEESVQYGGERTIRRRAYNTEENLQYGGERTIRGRAYFAI